MSVKGTKGGKGLAPNSSWEASTATKVDNTSIVMEGFLALEALLGYHCTLG